jgi:hypothetical protein
MLSVRSPLVWPLLMLLTRPLASCPETGHLSFVSTHVANSWVAGMASGHDHHVHHVGCPVQLKVARALPYELGFEG